MAGKKSAVTSTVKHFNTLGVKTKVFKNHQVNHYDYELSSSAYSMDWNKRSRYALLLEINSGKLVLDF